MPRVIDRVTLDNLFHAARGRLHLYRIQAASLDIDGERRTILEERTYAIQLLLDFERRGSSKLEWAAHPRPISFQSLVH